MKKKLKYDVIGAGPVDHPREIMKKVAEIHDFKIISSECLPIGDCWIFLVEAKTELSYMPAYIRELEFTLDDNQQ